MDHVQQTITDLQATIRQREEEIIGYKRTVNMLCQTIDMPPVYDEASLSPTKGLDSIRPDTFYGQPLNSSIKRILEMRKAAGLGPASVNEIFDALTRGGYQFEAKNAENAKRGLRISLGKSTHTFHRLPNGSFGLLIWYPEVKDPRGQQASSDDATGDTEPNGAEKGEPNAAA